MGSWLIRLVSLLDLLLGLLAHAQFQTPDLVLDVLVVFLELAAVDDLPH